MTPQNTQPQLPNWDYERGSVLAGAKWLHMKALVGEKNGNVSSRVTSGPDSFMAITGSGIGYESMSMGDIVVVDFQGDPILGDAIPSTESLLHAAIYLERSEINAVVHTHSIYASALAVRGLSLPPIIDEMIIYIGGEIQIAEYGFPGTDELAKYSVDALGTRNAVLLRNHGLVAVGSSVAEALEVSHLTERIAKIFVYAEFMGGAKLLPKDVISAELELFQMRRAARLEELNFRLEQRSNTANPGYSTK